MINKSSTNTNSSHRLRKPSKADTTTKATTVNSKKDEASTHKIALKPPCPRSSRTSGPAATSTSKPSHLSCGPKNPNHKTFRENEEHIINALCTELSKRHIDIKAKEIYTHAGVTSPTFYFHHHTSNDTLLDHERKLKRQFYRSLSADSHSDVIYAKLTTFIARNRNYFLATINNDDYYLLTKLITRYRHNLVGKDISDRTFCYYLGSTLITIECWLKLDGITPETTKACAIQLAKLRPGRYW